MSDHPSVSAARLRRLGCGSIISINGIDMVILDNEPLDEPGFDLLSGSETKEEGFELFLAEGTEAGERDTLDFDHRLRCFDRSVRYELKETREGTDHMPSVGETLRFDYEGGETRIYSSSWSPKPLPDIRIILVSVEGEEEPISSISIVKEADPELHKR